ncbi:TIGR01777 family oxidoreductase [Microbacterium sediminicola]|uniref:TIGR01777 family oxidoreductase n=1 Tax=Microbacterium sediminicola TaxID=415210 RepID=A0ABP4TZL1_9MICO
MPDRPLRHVVLAGGSGLLGRGLSARLRADGVRVTTLVRRPPVGTDEISWLQEGARLDPAVLDGVDAVVALNGASIGRLPWTRRYRHELLWSRVTPTRVLAEAIRARGADAPHFVSASAVGYYGAVPSGPVTEGSPRGEGFLADVCGEWEAAAAGAGAQTPITTLRTAPVIHEDGVLKPLILLTRAGLSGPLGRGVQEWPWISYPDAVGAITHILHRRLTGPVNLTGPARATANDIGFALAQELNRPYLLRAPAWALRLALGRDAASALLLTDAHVEPDALRASGFIWTHPTAEHAVHAAVADNA